MTLFQGSGNDIWGISAYIAAGAMCLAIWYTVIIGRDRPTKRRRRGENNVENYGVVEENHAPIPKFLIYTFIGTAIWGLVYLLWTGIEGVTGFR